MCNPCFVLCTGGFEGGDFRKCDKVEVCCQEVLILNEFTPEVVVQTPHTPHTKFDGHPFANLEDE